MVLVGLVAILGHMYPCWIGLRGGKGVATALGVAAVLSPWATSVALGVYLVTLATKRIPSLSSLVAAMTFAVVQGAEMVKMRVWEEQWSLAVFTLAVPLLIIYRHRSNIGRILRGEEPRVGRETSGQEPSPGGDESPSEEPGTGIKEMVLPTQAPLARESQDPDLDAP